SPAWGVKFDGSGPVKLYSLFSEIGDIEINAQYLTVDQATSVPFIGLRGNGANSLKSKGVVNNINSAAICVVAKPPNLASGTDYGSFTTLALCEIIELTAASTVEDVNKQKYES